MYKCAAAVGYLRNPETVMKMVIVLLIRALGAKIHLNWRDFHQL
jgi:hypothetical protein